MYLLVPFILQNFYKKILELIQSYEDVRHFWDQNCPFILNKFFGTNHCYYFHLPIGTFHCVKLQKILTTDPELWRCTIFGPKVDHLPQTNIFLENYYYHSHLPISPFHCAKFKKNSSSGSRVVRMCNLWPISPNKNFFSENLLMSLISFILAYLHAKNQSQILIY